MKISIQKSGIYQQVGPNRSNNPSAQRSPAHQSSYTKVEKPNALKRLFDKTDSDGDGLLSRDEIKGGIEALQKKMDAIIQAVLDNTGGKGSTELRDNLLQLMGKVTNADEQSKSFAAHLASHYTPQLPSTAQSALLIDLVG